MCKPITHVRYLFHPPLVPTITSLLGAVITMLLFMPVARSQETGTKAAATPTPVPLEVYYVDTYGRNPHMGDRISVGVNGLPEAIRLNQVKPKELVLYLNGMPLKGVHPESINGNVLVFKLHRTADSMPAWNALLGRPNFTNPLRTVEASVGMPEGQSFRPAADARSRSFSLMVYRPRWAVGSLIAFLVMIILLWKFGRSELIRDSGPPKPEAGKRKPFSLAKVQVAWWFLLVVGSFLLIYLITGEFTMSEQALMLMGIGTGTALGAAMIDANKRTISDNELSALEPEKSKLQAEVNELESTIRDLEAKATRTDAEKETLRAARVELAEKRSKLATTEAKITESQAAQSKPVSEGFAKDLLTDSNGVSFHRFQMIVWTLVLGVLFIIGVYKDLAMPEFSGTMIALMGISAGTYLGFKIPERQT